jgi:hypothetical protein
MSNAHRRFIPCQLLEGEGRVAGPALLTGLERSTPCRSNGVKTGRKAQNILRSLAGDDLDQVIGALNRFCCAADPAHPAAD